jgi:uncharacterized protein
MSDAYRQFVWYDLMTTDTAAAESFYRDVIGWRAHDSGLIDRRYSLLTAGDVPVSGMMELPKKARDAGGRPRWMGYVGVGDVDEFTEKVRGAGGTIHRAAEDIPGVGRFAIVADPQGAVFALFHDSADGPAPSAPPGTPGHIGWRELHAANWQEAFAFYSALFGWRKDAAVDMGPFGTYQLFAAGGPAIGGMMTKSDALPGPYWLFYWNVEDIEAAAARASGKGGRVFNEPHQVPGGSWIVQCSDPQGATFALVGPHR